MSTSASSPAIENLKRAIAQDLQKKTKKHEELASKNAAISRKKTEIEGMQAKDRALDGELATLTKEAVELQKEAQEIEQAHQASMAQLQTLVHEAEQAAREVKK